MQLPERSLPLGPGRLPPSRAAACREDLRRRWRASQLRPVAAVAAGFVHLRLRGARAAVTESDAGRVLPEAEHKVLHEHLVELTPKELREVADKIGLNVSERRSSSRAFLITRLMKPAVILKTKKQVMPDESPVPAIGAETLRDLEAYLETVTAQRLPSGVGRGRARQEDAPQSATSIAEAKNHADSEQQALPICDVHYPLLRQVGRSELGSFKVGQDVRGTLVEVSLRDGLRVDIGAEVDVLVPVALEVATVASVVASTYPVGTELTVKIEDVSKDPSRRFPVIATIDNLPSERDKILKAKAALRPHAGGQRDSARGGDPKQLAALPLDDWQPEGTLPEHLNQDLKEVPRRPPPAVVRSLGPNRRLQEVQVPEQLRPEAAAATSKAREAWEEFAEEQIERLRWELRCRDRLASDLLMVEGDLLQGRLSSIPTELMGLTVSEDGNSCLLPVPDGDCLKFEQIAFNTSEDLQDWIRDKREASAAEAVKPESKEQLAQFFACADAWHARMVQAAEAVEIQKLGWGRGQNDDDDDDNLAAAMAQMIANTPELEDQESMEATYLLKDLSEQELLDLESGA